jgi:hypothetical protein
MSSCIKWLEAFIKQQGSIAPVAVYTAGKAAGFSRKEIRAARRWHDKWIVTEDCDGETTWRWT